MLVVKFHLKNTDAWFKLQELHRYIILSCDNIHPTAMFDTYVIEESIIIFSFIPYYTLKIVICYLLFFIWKTLFLGITAEHHCYGIFVCDKIHPAQFFDAFIIRTFLAIIYHSYIQFLLFSCFSLISKTLLFGITLENIVDILFFLAIRFILQQCLMHLSMKSR